MHNSGRLYAIRAFRQKSGKQQDWTGLIFLNLRVERNRMNAQPPKGMQKCAKSLSLCIPNPKFYPLITLIWKA